MVQGSRPTSAQPSSSASSGDWSIVGVLPAGVIVWGGIGKLLDTWLGTGFLTPIGLASGFVLATYLVYVKIVREPHAAPAVADSGSAPHPAAEGEVA